MLAKPCIAAVFGLLTALFATAGGAFQQGIGVPPSDDGFNPVGSDACRTCHRALHTDWERSPHALAAEVLTFEQSFDPQCAPCHLPDDGVFDDGVGCEACHGPGSAYAELDVMIDPVKRAAAGLRGGPEACVYCHNPNHPFHVERDLETESTRVHRR